MAGQITFFPLSSVCWTFSDGAGWHIDVIPASSAVLLLRPIALLPAGAPLLRWRDGQLLLDIGRFSLPLSARECAVSWRSPKIPRRLYCPRMTLRELGHLLNVSAFVFICGGYDPAASQRRYR